MPTAKPASTNSARIIALQVRKFARLRESKEPFDPSIAVEDSPPKQTRNNPQLTHDLLVQHTNEPVSLSVDTLCIGNIKALLTVVKSEVVSVVKRSCIAVH